MKWLIGFGIFLVVDTVVCLIMTFKDPYYRHLALTPKPKEEKKPGKEMSEETAKNIVRVATFPLYGIYKYDQIRRNRKKNRKHFWF